MDYPKIICFHNPDEDNGYLSNWYISTFTVDDVVYSSMEQYMMYQKAQVFHDKTIAQKILETNNVAEIKALGRAVQGYSDVIWNGIRQIIIYKGLLAKFQQNPNLRDQLRKTQDAILAECAVKDTVWGIGLSMKNPKRFSVDDWKGQNLLGFALMEVRKSI